ncbi:cell wall metabolism sensor histidine kinase WalK [Patulibacter sp.]|uniref:sensor histidine kinase n=1 Tax=Patulibacter sp. TaxID=1912859 RepID=UPI00271886D9|nr:HAMP domain-containing sensor histidine kinase [Patulibacter sp.]MDO9407885.1 HAMP domain-containing sensor histidine kinase [Patulibacter sp.]
MPLRRRLALTVALVALLVVLAAGAAAWLTTRSVLQGNVDDGLRAQARAAVDGRGPRPGRVLGGVQGGGGPTGGDYGSVLPPRPPVRDGGPADYTQALSATGSAPLGGDVELPVTTTDRDAVARGVVSDPRDVTVDGTRLRMITVPVGDLERLRYARFGLDVEAFQFARSMSGVDSALRTLWIVLLLVGVFVVGTAALLARATARRVLRPVTDLAAAAAHVEATADLDGRLPVRAADEVGELTSRFNGMLARLQRSRAELDRSMDEQRNLVADASHELRTPVTSLRTNAEVLLEDDEALSPQERRSILADVRDQAEDLGALVADLIELARGDTPDHGADEPVALDGLAEECVGRARRDHRGVTFTTTTSPVVVAGRPDRLARAIQNLLNNAALHGARGDGPVEVHVGTTADSPAPAATSGAPGRPSTSGASAAAAPLDAPGAPLWAGHAGTGPGAGHAGAGSDAGRPAVVRVVDHGGGVTDEERERIFDRFRRGDTSRGRHGSGLGLAIVRQVATVHGGTIDVEETPGGGATFVLTLPSSQD